MQAAQRQPEGHGARDGARWASLAPIEHRGVDWFRAPVGTVRDEVEVPSGRLARFCWGEPGRPRIVFFPGITGSKEDFSLVGPPLAALGYRVEAVDLAGQYESDQAGPVGRGSYDLALHMADMQAVLELAGPAHVVGYSFAGLVAQRLVVEHPHLFRSLTFLAAPPCAGNTFSRVRVLGPFAHLASPRVAAALMVWGVKWNLNGVDRERLRFVRARFARTRHESVIDAMREMMNAADLEAQLRACGVPMLVAAGDGDLWPTAEHRAFAQRIGAGFRSYRTGHSPSETTPRELVIDLAEFYSDLSARSDAVTPAERADAGADEEPPGAMTPR